MAKVYHDGMARGIVDHENMEIAGKIVELNTKIETESGIVNILSLILDRQVGRMDKGHCRDNDVVMSIEDDYKKIRIRFDMDDVHTAIADIEALLGIHNIRLGEYDKELDKLLNGKYNKLLDNVR